MREKILTHLQSGRWRPLKVRGLARFFDVSEESYHEVRALIKELIREGQIEVGPRGKLVPPRPEKPAAKAAKAAAPRAVPAGAVRGRFSLSERGFGFVMPEGGDQGPSKGEDIFIGPNDHLDAVTNDTVLARVAGRSSRGYYGKILEVLERGQVR
ncbi:MAG: hypothetical protein NT049_18120, partial [Planctomycetota bacterium]|nr:hypothetical protein [Planctomycetota bacterium]